MRPIHKLRHLLEPRSAAIVGVSEKLNPGRIILNNLVREGFDRERIYVVKPGSDQIGGCRCVPDIASLPEKVDLFILAVSAAQAPEIVAEIIERQKAESLIVIPGGLEEKKGTEALVARMRGALEAARGQRVGRAAHQRRQLPRRPVAAGSLRHDVHPGVQAAGPGRPSGRRWPSSRRAARSPWRG